MSPMEILLRISVVQADMIRLASEVDPHTAAVLTHASRMDGWVHPSGSLNYSKELPQLQVVASLVAIISSTTPRRSDRARRPP